MIEQVPKANTPTKGTLCVREGNGMVSLMSRFEVLNKQNLGDIGQDPAVEFNEEGSLVLWNLVL